MKDELRDLISFVILKAPDRFPADTEMTLDAAFDEITRLLKLLNLDNQFIGAVRAAYKSYSVGDQKSAIKNLQIVRSSLT
ncbi:hypothetical protein [Oxalicibacterium solurbis]|uniref:Uncharacterized protein n=1 Tax=Oxalicibacterium solurbis TaxID=69280 RepID=A0A8J3AUR2_9BURK|nr:hypothetical protein [Oxalicibacterium solurbis]GGI53575.1 hypothetical protein GCM10011430_07490 [Oxalicibacterium solurbis]